MRNALIAAAIAAGSLIGTVAAALPPLISADALTAPLVEARAADLIRRGCPAYSVNMLRALSEAKALEKRAVSAGYPKDEVRAFIKDKEAKAEIYKRADALLRDLGARKGDQASICAAGDALVARGGVASRLIFR